MGYREDILADATYCWVRGDDTTVVDITGNADLTFASGSLSWIEVDGQRYFLGSGVSNSLPVMPMVPNYYSVIVRAITPDTTEVAGEYVNIFNGNAALNGTGVILRYDGAAYYPSAFRGGIAIAPNDTQKDSSTHLYETIWDYNGGGTPSFHFLRDAANYQGVNAPINAVSGSWPPVNFNSSSSKTYLSEVLFIPRSLTVDERAWLAVPGNSLDPRALNTVAPTLTFGGSTWSGTVGAWDSQSNGTLTYAWELRRDSDDGVEQSGTGSSPGGSNPTVGDYYLWVRGSNDGGYYTSEDSVSSTETVAGGGGSPQTISLDASPETDVASALTIVNPRTYALGKPTDSEAAHALSIANPRTYFLGQTTAADSANSLSVINQRTYQLGVASESNSSPSINVANPRSYALGQAIESNLAYAIDVTAAHVVSLGRASGVSIGRALTMVNPRAYLLGSPVETQAALTLTVRNPRSLQLGCAMSVESARLLHINPGSGSFIRQYYTRLLR